MSFDLELICSGDESGQCLCSLDPAGLCIDRSLLHKLAGIAHRIGRELNLKQNTRISVDCMHADICVAPQQLSAVELEEGLGLVVKLVQEQILVVCAGP